MEKRIPPSSDLYGLYHLSLDHDKVVRGLESLGCSSVLAVDTRHVTNGTLMVASHFLIPTLGAILTGASVSKELEGQIEPREFFNVACKAIEDGPPLAKTCYKQGVRTYGLAIELELVLPSALDPRTVASEYSNLQ